MYHILDGTRKVIPPPHTHNPKITKVFTSATFMAFGKIYGNVNKGHFRVAVNLIMKATLSAKLFI